ncbi:oligoendopeptidase F [Sphingobacterium sp. UT-1RO-CII-1]|uniref:oligoendopeptidase F n=1 Tax=Sphingobacterium sp. UT-1RO-CII-1 TaxID=2995225 RepID=UPI00227B33E7|nr:oligoendopeptidase F [Sphingobacterium sp. UT-1RO-CII-1]MCY4780258.1 oligoendopeptidase F [Sphingobacterium sp. UT-1RO-CII-1]
MRRTTQLMTVMMLFSTTVAVSQMKVREELDDTYKWDLTPLYASDDSWKDEKNRIQKEIQQLSSYKGKLTGSASMLLEGLELNSDLIKEMVRLSSYASMKSDQDTRVTKYAGLTQEMQQLFATYGALTSFVEPELLTLEESQLNTFLEQESRLRVYEFYLKDLLRKRAHRGSEEVEKVMAYAGLMSGNAANIYSTFSNAEFPYPEIELNGESVKLNAANFALYRTSEDRSIRSKVFSTYFEKLNEFQRTFGAQLYGNINAALFTTKARNYESTLARALDDDHIPTDVFHNLVKNVNGNLETFHRYLNLRKRMMGVDTLHYYDLYAPLVAEVDLEYTVEEAVDNILESLHPLGTDYVEVSKKAFNERWIDMYPNEGKRSGAYSNGSAYDVHPYILMNYNGQYNDMSTLTHELGHTMHSYLTNSKQHFANANYSIFVAEVASTLNEELLNDHMLRQIKDDNVRLAILGNYLEGAKGTLFRQTQFAEFEFMIHDKVANGEALTGEDFDAMYLDLTRKYYGHDKNVCIVDDYVKSEWSYIPHFYYNFYVYQYATSFTASTALSEKVLRGTATDRKRYLDFLAAGSTKYPVDLLVDAGVDMNTSEPFDLTISKINKVMSEMEAILSRLGK